MEEIIKINVGGQYFTTYKSTLLNSDYFKSYFERWEKDKHFLDLDPNIFQHVLNILRDPNYEIPKKYYNNVVTMAEYLCLPLPQESINDEEIDKNIYYENSKIVVIPFQWHNIKLYNCKKIHDLIINIPIQSLRITKTMNSWDTILSTPNSSNIMRTIFDCSNDNKFFLKHKYLELINDAITEKNQIIIEFQTLEYGDMDFICIYSR